MLVRHNPFKQSLLAPRGFESILKSTFPAEVLSDVQSSNPYVQLITRKSTLPSVQNILCCFHQPRIPEEGMEVTTDSFKAPNSHSHTLSCSSPFHFRIEVCEVCFHPIYMRLDALPSRSMFDPNMRGILLREVRPYPCSRIMASIVRRRCG